MTTTDIAMPALPTPRREQVLHLLPRVDLERRPAGRHTVPSEDLLDIDAHWEGEAEALAAGETAAYTHGRRCSCCAPDQPAEAAS
jgi:hypothetical protein